MVKSCFSFGTKAGYTYEGGWYGYGGAVREDVEGYGGAAYGAACEGVPDCLGGAAGGAAAGGSEVTGDEGASAVTAAAFNRLLHVAQLTAPSMLSYPQDEHFIYLPRKS